MVITHNHKRNHNRIRHMTEVSRNKVFLTDIEAAKIMER